MRAFDVYKPLRTSTPVDLLIINGRALKCQCKVLFQDRDGRHVFQFSTLTSEGHHNELSRRKYTDEEVDFFLHVRRDNEDVYVIPYADVIGHSDAKVWITAKPKIKAKRAWFEHEKYKNAWHLLQ